MELGLPGNQKHSADKSSPSTCSRRHCVEMEQERDEKYGQGAMLFWDWVSAIGISKGSKWWGWWSKTRVLLTLIFMFYHIAKLPS